MFLVGTVSFFGPLHCVDKKPYSCSATADPLGLYRTDTFEHLESCARYPSWKHSKSGGTLRALRLAGINRKLLSVT